MLRVSVCLGSKQEHDLRAGSPPGEEERKTDSLEDTSNGTNGNGIKRALLSEDLGDELDELAIAPRSHVLVHTEGAELAKKIKDPRYAAPL